MNVPTRALFALLLGVGLLLSWAGCDSTEEDPARLRVVHRVLADGEVLPVGLRVPGAVFELQLEPFAAHPQLESLYLSDHLEPDPGARLWFDPRVEP